MLQQEGWAAREALSSVVFDDRWGQGASLFDAVARADSAARP
jgi:hypothetical protein